MHCNPHRTNMTQPANFTEREFPPFSLTRLLRTVFTPKGGERVCILIDLDDPRDITGFRFLGDAELTIQRHAHDVFYEGLKNGVLSEMNLQGGEIYAYEKTGGSNLDLPDIAFTPEGKQVSLVDDVYKKYDIILCISTYSATAPLTAFAKQHGFRGATMHGMNEVILSSGLAVNYDDVSREAEKLRSGMTILSSRIRNTRCAWNLPGRRRRSRTGFAAAVQMSRIFPPGKFTMSRRARRGCFPCATRMAPSACSM